MAKKHEAEQSTQAEQVEQTEQTEAAAPAKKRGPQQKRAIDTTRAVLTTADVASLLGVSTTNVTVMAANKELPHMRVSQRVVRFPRAAILAWIERRTVDAN